MATKGTYTAYRALKPLEGDVSQDMQQQQENSFRNRTLKLAEDKASQDRADAIEAKKKPIKLPDTPYSEYVSHDKRTIDLFTGDQNLIKEYADNEQALIKDPYNSQFIIKKKNMDNAIEQIAKAQSGISGKAKALQEGLNTGVLSPSLNKDYVKNYNSLIDATGYSYKLNKNTGVVSVEVPDANSDGIPDEFSLQDAYDPSKLTGFKKKFQDESFLTAAKQRYGSREEVIDPSTGYIKETLKGFDKNKIIDLNSEVNTLFGNDVSNMTDEAKSYLADTLKVDPSTIKDIEFSKMKNDFGKRLINSYETTDKKEFDSGDQNADQSRAQSDRHFQQTRADKKSGEPKEEMGPNNINQVGVVKGNTPKEGSVLKNMDGAKAYSVEGSNLERTIGQKGASQRVNNIYVLKDGKTLAFEVDNVDGTSTIGTEGVDQRKASNTKKILYRSDKDANEIGDFISKKKNPKTGDYYKNIPEFMEDALGIPQKKANAKTKSTKPKTVSQGGYTYTLNEKTGQYE